MSNTAGNGAGDGVDFDPASDYYDPGTVHNGGTGSAAGSGLHADSAFQSGLKDILVNPAVNIAFGFLGDGVYDKVSSAMQSSHPEQLTQLASTWSTIANRTIGYCTDLTLAIAKIGSSWSGDDADMALTILKGIHATLNSQYSKSSDMATALQNMGSNMQQMKNSFHSQSTTSTITNSFTGSDDRRAESAYKNLMEAMKSDLHLVPQTVPKQLKGGGSTDTPNFTAPATHAGGPQTPPAVGGAGSSAHVGNPANPTITNPHHVDPNIGRPDLTHPPVSHPVTDPSTHLNPGNPTYPGVATSSPYTGGGAGLGGTPGVDTSGSLAGYGGSGAGGAGSLGGGAGAGGLSNAGGAGAGAGIGGGAGGVLGAGAGAGGPGSGSGGGVIAGGGAGGRGVMPMHGGQHDDDERERTTWLTEEDDVWGAEENLPGVIH